MLFVLAIVAGIRSLASGTEVASSPTQRMLEKVKSRLRKARMHQSLKIIVVSWQIITQVSVSDLGHKNEGFLLVLGEYSEATYCT